MPEKFTMPSAETKNYREANHKQLRDFILTMLENTAEERKAWFKPDRSSIEGFERSIAGYRSEFLASIGYPPAHSPVETKQTTTYLGEDDEITVYRAYAAVCEGLDCYSLIMKPKMPGPRPLLIAVHGGGGCPDTICDMDRTGNYNGAGRDFARAGYIVCAPMLLFRPFVDGDASGIPPQSRAYMDRLCHAAGTRLTSVEMLKISRTIDAMLLREDVLKGGVSIAGLSYGGYYALMCAAAETRIETVYSSCIFGDHIRYMLRGDRADTEFVWHDSERRFSFAEIAALVCPRRLIIEAGQGDAVIPIDATRRIVPFVRQLYEDLGVGERLHYVENGSSHEFMLRDTLGLMKPGDGRRI